MMGHLKFGCRVCRDFAWQPVISRKMSDSPPAHVDTCAAGPWTPHVHLRNMVLILMPIAGKSAAPFFHRAAGGLQLCGRIHVFLMSALVVFDAKKPPVP